ncbi:metallophosphoesterase, partial [Deinococcus pimensis]|uniref:metallophosphoesterase n=1 Tax=Deinococcus pimensis TaxID=309888 RepID=UPI001B7FE65A
MTGARPLWVMGDVHGEPAKLRALLRHAGLIGDGDVWTGGGAVLVCIGDYTDRGPDGVGVLDLLLRVDEDAARAGGRLYALLGNHETLLLAAHAFGDHWQDPRGRTFL